MDKPEGGIERIQVQYQRLIVPCQKMDKPEGGIESGTYSVPQEAVAWSQKMEKPECGIESAISDEIGE